MTIKIRLTKKISKVTKNIRLLNKCKHKILSMIRQRIYGIDHGYEDLNNQNELRNNLFIQTAVGNNKKLAIAPALSRSERTINRKSLFKINQTLVEVFITSHKKSPKEIILDFDSTSDKVHSNQFGAMFHGYYNCKCFFPLYFFVKII